jgi:hypothetical protein
MPGRTVFCRQSHGLMRRQAGPTQIHLPHACRGRSMPRVGVVHGRPAGLQERHVEKLEGGDGGGGHGEEAAASEAGGRGDDHPRGRGAGEGM